MVALSMQVKQLLGGPGGATGLLGGLGLGGPAAAAQGAAAVAQNSAAEAQANSGARTAKTFSVRLVAFPVIRSPFMNSIQY